MRVLGIESSCDETAAAVVEDGRRVRSSVVASQVEEHARFGGIHPETASRRHLENIGPVVDRALEQAEVGLGDIDGIAVTRGPGLVGSLLVGLSYAKALAWARGLPLVGVNHIAAHIAALGLEHPEIGYPALALVVSGGHTALYLQRDPDGLRLIGRTRDDAVGEAFDKVARLLGLGYPGGPVVDRLSRSLGVPQTRFGRPRIGDGAPDFSFSGLKTAVARRVRDLGLAPARPGEPVPEAVRDVAAGFQRAAVDALVEGLARAARDWRPVSLLLGGGVACNSLLRAEVTRLGGELGMAVHLPSPALSTDNAAMIAALGHRRLARGERDPIDLDADPSLEASGGPEGAAPAAGRLSSRE